MRVLITYDLGCDDERRRIASALERVGFRVQKSVFECQFEEKEDLDRAVARIGNLLGPEPSGDIRFYRLCQDCFAASFGLGEVEQGTGGEPWIVV